MKSGDGRGESIDLCKGNMQKAGSLFDTRASCSYPVRSMLVYRYCE